MSKIDEEIEKLSQEEELFDLETLIIEGSNALYPIVFDYPTPSGDKKVTAKIRPLTSSEIQNAALASRKTGESYAELVLKKGLYTKDEKQFPPELISKMAGGVVAEISNKISEISGIKIDEEETNRLVGELMGF